MTDVLKLQNHTPLISVHVRRSKRSRGGAWVVITWAAGMCPFAIPDASWVAVAPQSGHAGWCVRHQVWGDIQYMHVITAGNLLKPLYSVALNPAMDAVGR